MSDSAECPAQVGMTVKECTSSIELDTQIK